MTGLLENPEAVEVDPVELKLAEGTYETMQLNGVFGALRDASPDFGVAASLISASALSAWRMSIICSNHRTIMRELSVLG